MNKKTMLLITFLCIMSFGYSQNRNLFTGYNTDSKTIYSICFTYKGEALAIADNRTITVYKTISKELISKFENGHNGQILTIDISKDSSLLVSGGKDSAIVVWDFNNRIKMKSFKYHKGIITSIKISPDCRYILSGGSDNRVYLYDLKLNQVIREFTDHKDIITSVAFNPHGTLILSASADKSINIYMVENGKLIKSIEGHKSWIRDIEFSKDGNKLISCGDDSRIIIWNFSDINRIYKQEDTRFGNNWLISASFNEDCKTYVLGGMNRKVKIVGQFSTYRKKIGAPINKVLFKPNDGVYLRIALATTGKGVVFIDAMNMKIGTH